MSPSNDPSEFWSPERLEQAAYNELIAHGGNKDDLKQLKAEFQKARENISRDVISNENIGTQTGEIPS